MEIPSFEAGYMEEEVALEGSESEGSFHFWAAGAALTSSERQCCGTRDNAQSDLAHSIVACIKR